jgi:hypothetical protein
MYSNALLIKLVQIALIFRISPSFIPFISEGKSGSTERTTLYINDLRTTTSLSVVFEHHNCMLQALSDPLINSLAMSAWLAAVWLLPPLVGRLRRNR